MNRKRKYEIVVCLIACTIGAVMVGLNVSKLSNAGNVALYQCRLGDDLSLTG